MQEFKIGDLVVLTLDSPGKVGITYGLNKLKGQKFRINGYKSLTGAVQTNRHAYYTLKGCVTKYGIPYAITPDWIKHAEDKS